MFIRLETGFLIANNDDAIGDREHEAYKCKFVFLWKKAFNEIFIYDSGSEEICIKIDGFQIDGVDGGSVIRCKNKSSPIFPKSTYPQ